MTASISQDITSYVGLKGSMTHLSVLQWSKPFPF